VATFRHGPRVVDLDIVFYDQAVMDNTSSSESDDPDRGGEKGDLIIPHPRCEEREFVLRPVAESVSPLLLDSL
jgi:dihydroneopterin aldolase/2-amino-4-hydroxy-6-hydroxymethyldihydropteridine diphosphokinase/dihydropteroate synthase